MGILKTAAGLFDSAWTALSRPLVRLLNVLFRPDRRDGAIGAGRLVAWIVVNAAILMMALRALNPRFEAMVVGVFVLVHLLVIFASLRVMSEEKRVLEGSLAADRMTFSVFDAVNNLSLLATSIVFYLLGLPALIGLVEDGGIARILAKRPPIPSPYGANLACVLNELPGVGPLMNAIANMVGVSANLNADIVYTGLVGNIARMIIVATVGFMVASAVMQRVQQASHRKAILRSVEAGHIHPDRIHDRLLRLPRATIEHLRRVVSVHADADLRQRFEAVLAKLGRLHP